MIATELQRIVVRLSNQCWCRHWLNFFNTTKDVKMAIQCVDFDGSTIGINPIQVKAIEDLGFRVYHEGKAAKFIHLIDRTNEDGTPFESKIF